MPQPSYVGALPAEARHELEALITDHGFANYDDLHAKVIEAGFDGISLSALKRVGLALKNRLGRLRASTDVARLLVEGREFESATLAEATLHIIQEQVFDGLLEAQELDIDQLGAAANSVAKLVRAQGTLVEARVRWAAQAGAAAEGEARKRGLSDEAAAAIRRKVEGSA